MDLLNNLKFEQGETRMSLYRCNYWCSDDDVDLGSI